MKLPKIVVRRGEWNRGQGDEKSYLVSNDGYCIWGWILLALGVGEDELWDEQDPQPWMITDSEVLDLIFTNNELQAWAVKLEKVNREALITEILEAKGFEVEYID